jgi:homogentisate 1,2-dioxygenase
MHMPFERLDDGRITSDFAKEIAPPNQLRWNPLPIPEVATDLIQGLVTMAGNGDPGSADRGGRASLRRQSVDEGPGLFTTPMARCFSLRSRVAIASSPNWV